MVVYGRALLVAGRKTPYLPKAVEEAATLQPTHSVSRWRRFGNDRWYVNDGDGDAMGYYDAIKDVVVSERPEDDALVRAALRREGILP